MAIVYRHRRLDTFEIFYVGIGKENKRAYSKANRNSWWKNIVEKTEYSVEILFSNISWEEACELEMLFISEYGRKDLSTGILVNLTDGGEGIVGNIISDRTKEKMRLAKIGKRPPNFGKKASEEARKNMSLAHTGRTNSEASKEKNRIASKKVSELTKYKRYIKNKGKKRTEEQCRRISEAKTGKLNKNNIIILDVETGVYYISLKEACSILDYPRGWLLRRLKNNVKNNTNLRIV